jgi:hypothetical protein
MDDLEALKNLDLAMNNSFNLIVGDETLESISDNCELEHLVFIHDISSTHSDETISALLHYFTEKEDYEKCIVLSNINNNN